MVITAYVNLLHDNGPFNIFVVFLVLFFFMNYSAGRGRMRRQDRFLIVSRLPLLD